MILPPKFALLFHPRALWAFLFVVKYRWRTRFTPFDMKQKRIFFALCLLTVQISFAQKTTPVLPQGGEQMAQYALPVRTTGADFADLQFLKQEIGDKSIVALGEQTHFDGGSFEARSRLIRFLMEEMGFEVVLFEAGMYDMHQAEYLVHQTAQVDSLKKRLYYFWQTREWESLYTYFQSRITAQKPLFIHGFDTKITSALTYRNQSLSRYAEQVFRQHDAQLLTRDDVKAYLDFQRRIERNASRGGIHALRFKMKKKEKKRLQQWSDQMVEICQKIKEPELAQMIKTHDKGVLLYSELSIPKAIFNKKLLNRINNQRDILMAENLDYLLQQVYADKKVILIGANYHFLRTNDLIQPVKIHGIRLHQAAIMGNLVDSALKNRMYTICFTAYEGAHGLVKKETDKPQSVQRPDENSIEYVLAQKGFDNAFVSMRRSAKEAFWANQPTIRLFDYKTNTKSNHWPEMFDGLFFIREMKPAHQ